jgi:hypothetical protein
MIITQMHEFRDENIRISVVRYIANPIYRMSSPPFLHIGRALLDREKKQFHIINEAL